MRQVTFKSILILIWFLVSQTSVTADFYVESWKKGPARIKEKRFKFQLVCNGSKGSVDLKIKDEKNQDRFKLIIKPAERCDKDGVLGWTVLLFELGKESYEQNLLKPTNDPHQDFFTAVDIPGFFLAEPERTPLSSGMVPLLQPRVIKIESFYCILKATDIKYSEISRSKIRSLAIEVYFTNTYK